MFYHLSLLFLQTIFLCSVASSSLLQIFPLSPNTTSSLRDTPVKCKASTIFEMKPLFRDCTFAIGLLPSGRVSAFFHTDGLRDEWRLPVYKTVGTCDVTVRISPYAVIEASTWDHLKVAATRLNEACKTGKARKEITGGKVGVGNHGWIHVSIVRTGNGGEDAVDKRAG